MLTKIRSGVDNIIVKIILGIIALSFIGFSGASYNKGDAITFSDAESISMERFLKERNKKIDAFQKQNGINLTEEKIKKFNIDQAVLQDLITSSMIEYIAKKYEFDISDEQIISFAKSSSMFWNSNGEFDPEIYKAAFDKSKHNEAKFLELIRNQIVHGTVANLFSASYKVPSVMTDNMINLMAESKDAKIYKMNLSFKDKSFKPKTPDTELLKEIYDSNKNVFVVPESRSIKYVKITKEYLSKKIKITDKEAKRYFEENPEEFIETSYSKAKKQAKILLTNSLLDDLLSKFSRDLEDDIASGISLEELSKKYSVSLIELNNKNKNELLSSKNEDHIELAEHVFEMISGETSYPIEIKDKHEIFLITLDSITPERFQEFDEVKSKIIDLWKSRELSIHNMNNFIKFSEEKGTKYSPKSLENKGISLKVQNSISRTDVENVKMPPALFHQIFKIEDGTKTKIIQGDDGFAYFAYLEKSYIDTKKKKMVEEKGLNHFQNTIKESLLQEMIINATLKNNVKVHIGEST